MDEIEEGASSSSTERQSFYGLIKAFAKLPPEEGCDALSKELAAGRKVEELSSKGSTALHACAYLQRWDLARILLAAGADPAAKNQSGHSFFMTMVRFPGAPWRELLENFPDLIAKHERFLSKRANGEETRSESRSSRSAKKKKAAPADQSMTPDGGETVEEERKGDLRGARPARGGAQGGARPEAMAHLSDELDLDFEGLRISSRGLFKRAQDALRAKHWLELAGILRVLGRASAANDEGQSLAQLAVATLGREELVEAIASGVPLRARGEGGVSVMHEAVLRKKPELVQLLVLNHAEIDCRDSEGRSPMSVAVGAADEDMVERLLAFGARAKGFMSSTDARSYEQYAEERGLLGLADMISSELECQPELAHSARSEMSSSVQPKRSSGNKGRGNGGGRDKRGASSGPGGQPSGHGSGFVSGRKNPRSGQGGRGGGGRKAPHLIANLDRPIKEASDYSYSEPKVLPADKQPLIIIKKSRMPRPGGGGGGGAGSES